MTAPPIFPELFRRYARESPERLAILAAPAERVSYGTLAQRTFDIGRLLRSVGIGRNGRVATLMPNSSTLVIAITGVVCHATLVPLDPCISTAEINALQGRLQLDAILTDGREPPLVDWSMRRDTISGLSLFAYGNAAKQESVVQDEAIDSKALALIVHTSGTTSLPKLVAVTHGNLAVWLQRFHAWLDLTSADRAYCVAKLYYGFGLQTLLLAPLSMGGSMALPPLDENCNPQDAIKWLDALQPTYIAAAPAFLLHLLDQASAQERTVHHHLRFIQTGGAPLAASAKQALEDAFHVPILEAYGLSEAGQLASNGPRLEFRRQGTVGRPEQGTVAIRGEDGRILGPGEEGEVMAGGSSISVGYLDHRGQLQPILSSGWYATGDLGLIDHDGFLTITGRLKDIINRGGEKISPSEIDSILAIHPAVAEAATFAVPHARLGEDVAAAVVLRPGAKATPLQLRRYLEDRLATFKVPRRIHFLDQLPQTASGKIHRAGLSKRFAIPNFEPRGSDLPRNSLEGRLATLWSDLLGAENVSTNVDFFMLGGDSLLAMHMMRELESIVGHDVPRSLLLQKATIRQIVDAVVAQETENQPLLLPLREEGGKQPLLLFDGDYGGGGYYTRHVLARIGEDRPLWLLRPFRISADGSLPSIEDMASHYLGLIREAELKPPFLFAGYCIGGLLALEVARQAEVAGDAVSLVAIIDSVSFNARPKIRTAAVALKRLSRLAGPKHRAVFERMMMWVWRKNVPGSDMLNQYNDFSDMMAATDAAYYKAMTSYIPPLQLSARLVCLTPQESRNMDEFCPDAWRTTSKIFESIVVPGSHQSCIDGDIASTLSELRKQVDQARDESL